MASAEFKDNSAQVLKEFNTRLGVALNVIGEHATAHLQDETPVRTGNLINHAGWEVAGNEKEVSVGFKSDANYEKNPDYAIYVENGSRTNRPNHMLQHAVTNHNDEYKNIAKKALGG